MRRLLPALVLTALLATACAAWAAGRDAEPAVGKPRTVAGGLQVPWGIAFLPGGAALVSERTTGRIMRIPRGGGKPRVAMRVPGVDTDSGEGGLLGIAVSPTYGRDKLVYAYFTSRGDNRVVRFRLGGKVRPVLTGLRRGFNHNGGRIAFGPDRKLYVAVGDAGDEGTSQNRASLSGKILRLNPGGSVPKGNPFGTRVWSMGHRNVQGLAWDGRGRLWATEFGQNSFDEVNLIRKGRNYGWPVVEGRGDTRGGRFTNPKVVWSTDQASPSGAAILRGRLYVGALQGEGVWRVRLRGASTGKRTLLFRGRFGRVRSVARAPGGSLWASTSNRDGRGDPRSGDDRIFRFRP